MKIHFKKVLLVARWVPVDEKESLREEGNWRLLKPAKPQNLAIKINE